MKLLDKFLFSLKYGNEQEILSLVNLSIGKNLINTTILLNNNLKIEKPLHIAVNRNLVKVIDKFIELGAEINSKDDLGYTLLLIAIEKGYLNIVNKLIEAKADITASDNLGYTPLHTAVESNSIDIVKKLLELGADINAQTNSGDTSLHFATYLLREDIVRLLISYNAKIDIKNLKQESPFFISVTESLSLSQSSLQYHIIKSIISSLIHAGTNTSIKGADEVEPSKKLISDNKVIYNTIDKEVVSYKAKKDSDFAKAENLFKRRIDFSKTSLSELAIDKVINYLDSEKTFHESTIVNIIKGAKQISACRRIEKESIGKEYKFEDYLGAVKEHTIKRIINSENQQKYYRKSFYPKKSFVEQEDKRVIECLKGNESGCGAN